MNAETLQSLLADRALQELAPETQELLEAYLEEHPEIAARAESLAATTRLARAALGTQTAPPSPMPVSGLPWKRRSLGTSAFWRKEGLRLAACVAFGALAGWEMRTLGPATPVVGSSPAVAALKTGALEPRPAARGASGFWSTANFTRPHPSGPTGTERSQRYRVDWNSPAKMPRLEEKL